MHVLKDGWDISFLIESGEMFAIEERGCDENIFQYIKENIKQWLEDKHSYCPQHTNREEAHSMWVDRGIGEN